MAKALVIDTSSKNLYTMVIDGKKTTKIILLDSQRQHSVLLNETIDKLLKEAQITLSEIEVLAVGIGVGSFTGIRVGVSVAKGYNLFCDKKFVEVNSLQTLAYTKKGCVNCLADAGKGFYYAVYDGLNQIQAPILISTQQAEEIMQLENSVCFDASQDYSQAIENQVRDKMINHEFSSTLTPLYVRRCQAEEERNT